MSASMAAGAGTIAHGVGPASFPWRFAMWGVMAVAMMVPTSSRLLALFTRYWSAKHGGRGLVSATWRLVLGYLTIWLVFAAAAALLQVWLERADLLAPVHGRFRSDVLGGAVMAGAGLFQLTPLKTACLARCRTPLMVLNTRWRDGWWGPYVIGLDDGLYCLGCCWALMLLMFVTGVMNLVWMGILTAVITLEKLLPGGLVLARVTGAVLLVAGVWRLLS